MAVTETAATYRGFAVDELIDDFRLACVSRAIDDREISMQKQSRVFFQISGAGHEAVGLGLARLLRPGYDWFFPYYRDQALVLGLGVTPTEVLLQAVGSADDPSSGGRQMPSHWGQQGAQHRHPVEPHRQPVHPGGRLRRGRPLHRAPATCPVARPRATSSPTSAWARAPRSEGEFWESLNTACNLHLPGAVPRGRQRLRHLGARPRPGPGAGGRAGQRASAGSTSIASTAPTTSRCVAAGARSSSTSVPASARL